MEDLLAHFLALFVGPSMSTWKGHLGGMFDILADVLEALSDVWMPIQM